MKEDNVIREKSTRFAIRIVEMYRYLSETKQEYVMSKQLLRSGTSIGANVREGIYAQSKSDFISKMNIALKEAAETEYWIELLSKTEYITPKQYASINEDCREVVKLLITITKSTKTEMSK